MALCHSDAVSPCAKAQGETRKNGNQITARKFYALRSRISWLFLATRRYSRASHLQAFSKIVPLATNPSSYAIRQTGNAYPHLIVLRESVVEIDLKAAAEHVDEISGNFCMRNADASHEQEAPYSLYPRREHIGRRIARGRSKEICADVAADAPNEMICVVGCFDCCKSDAYCKFCRCLMRLPQSPYGRRTGV